jgi:hypothetical protein
MNRVSVRAPLIALLIVIVTACGQSDAPERAVAAMTPESTVRSGADLLKQGDIGGLMRLLSPPSEYARMKSDWAKQKAEKTITEEDRQKFAETMAKLTAPDAEQALWAEWEPKLAGLDAEARKNMPMLVGMGRGWLQGMVQQSTTLAEPEKQQAKAAIDAFADWVQSTRFTDPALVRQVIAIACRVARETGLKTLDEARALDFDQTMQKAQILFLGFKDALAVYGFSLDATLDSVKPEVLSQAGDNAKVAISYDLLGAPLKFETDMQRVDGRWYGAKVIEEMHAHEAESAGAAKEAGEPPAVAPDEG